MENATPPLISKNAKKMKETFLIVRGFNSFIGIPVIDKKII